MLGVQTLGSLAPRDAAEGQFTASPTGTMNMPSIELPPAPSPPARDCAEDEREAWMVLLSVSGLGPITFESLLAAFGSAQAVLRAASGPAGAARLCEVLAVGGTSRELETATTSPGHEPRERQPSRLDLARRICETATMGSRLPELISSLGIHVVTLEDAAYPARLRRVDLPPPLLFFRGSIECLAGPRVVGVVGTRRPSDKGRLVSAWTASAIARAGGVVVSGLAVGIDGAAHAAVVGEGLPTVGVLGGGHARLFPRAHERLAEAIVAAGGALVSELPPETPATRGTFPRRNRVISGLSDAVVVVEAGQRSGALITAGWALEQGRECFLVPGAIDSPQSAGCNAFLRSFPGQARVVCGIPELLEDLELASDATEASTASPPSRSSAGKPAPADGRSVGLEAVIASLGPVERELATQLSNGPATADSLSERTGLAGAAVLSALTLLELRGLVDWSGGRYMPVGALARGPIRVSRVGP